VKLFGFEISRIKSPVLPTTVPSGWSTTFGAPFWGSSALAPPIVQEPFTGAWQRNMSINQMIVFYAIYRCIVLISQDISKMRIRLMEQKDPANQIRTEVNRNSPYWQVLEKPNRYQNRIQFFDEWVGSKLMYGNTYVLKERDNRGIVVRLYILNPMRCIPQVAPDGSVYYGLSTDDLAQIDDSQVVVPASEIIHDRYKPLYHPLCGIAPVLAAALSGSLGLSIQLNSGRFFENQSRPGGVLTAPEHIEDETAARLKSHWESNFSGANAGKVAVLGDGLKYEPMAENAVNSQLVEQLNLSAENVCTAFGVPPYMIGIGTPPSYNNIEALNQQYYSQCLQNLIETIEILMDEGLSLPPLGYGTEFDLEELLRMDTATKSRTWSDLVKGGIASPNEARSAFNMPPVEGGDSVFLQQQNYSLEALAKRDSQDDPFASSKTPSISSPPGTGDGSPPDAPPTKEQADVSRATFAERIKHYSRYQSRSAGL